MKEVTALKLSMDMWNWLRFHPTSVKSDYPGYYNHKINNMSSQCPCCEFYKTIRGCGKCPLHKLPRSENSVNVCCKAFYIWTCANTEDVAENADIIYRAIRDRYEKVSGKKKVKNDKKFYVVKVEDEDNKFSLVEYKDEILFVADTCEYSDEICEGFVQGYCKAKGIDALIEFNYSIKKRRR